MSDPIRVAPSLLSADFANLHESIREVEEAGCDLLHLDVMDGRFVPNITFGPVVVQAVRGATGLPLDVHLMIEEPIRHVDAFCDAGADWITVHVEACSDVGDTLARIRSRKVKPGITLRPGTPFDAVEPWLSQVELLLVMTVEPGFGGQSYMADQEAKLRRAADLRSSRGLGYAIEVDGGISRQTAAAAVDAGAEILVTGSALFGAPDLTDYVRFLKGRRQSTRRQGGPNGPGLAAEPP